MEDIRRQCLLTSTLYVSLKLEVICNPLVFFLVGDDSEALKQATNKWLIKSIGYIKIKHIYVSMIWWAAYCGTTQGWKGEKSFNYIQTQVQLNCMTSAAK